MYAFCGAPLYMWTASILSKVAEEKERIRRLAEKARLQDEAREKEKLEARRRLKEREKAWPNRIAVEHRPGTYSNIGRLEETRRCMSDWFACNACPKCVLVSHILIFILGFIVFSCPFQFSCPVSLPTDFT